MVDHVKTQIRGGELVFVEPDEVVGQVDFHAAGELNGWTRLLCTCAQPGVYLQRALYVCRVACLFSPPDARARSGHAIAKTPDNRLGLLVNACSLAL